MTARPVSEKVLGIECCDQQLTGILTCPPEPHELGVVIIVGGPQYRAGSHRQFVLLARALSAAGYCALRFDVRGMGDSGGDLRNFEHIEDDIDAAISAMLAAAPGVRRVVLWGLCDGASAALLRLQAHADARVAGLCLVNPWVRSDEGLARTQLKHYYVQRLLQLAFWRKLLTGQVAARALRDLWQSVRLASKRPAAAATSQRAYQERMALGLQGFAGPVLLLLSSDDYTAKEFVDHAGRSPLWQRALQRANVRQLPLQGADHTCSNPGSQAQLEHATTHWLDSWAVSGVAA